MGIQSSLLSTQVEIQNLMEMPLLAATGDPTVSSVSSHRRWTRHVYARWTIPRWMAAVAACVRSCTASLLRMFFTWFFTVCSAMFNE
jgi:hypothetical protein